MNKKVYGIMFGLGVFCMLGLSIVGTVSADADYLKGKHKAWKNESAGSWGFEVAYGTVGVGTSVSWENNHGAMVAGSVGTWNENQQTGTIGKYDAATKSVDSDHEGFWQDHYWNVKENYFLPDKKVYIEELGKRKPMYYTTSSYDMVHHHWVFNYKVKHTNYEWEETHSTTYDDLYWIVKGVHSNM